METQDHRKASQSGHEGHSGTNLCHKCGWLYPNPHPSARHRRAHRKVCGTIEGHKLDNPRDENTHLDVDVQQCVSNNDEHKTPSEKVVERNMSTRNNSGVYSDAAMDFVDGSGLEDASSDGVVCRQKSLQKITEVGSDSSKFATENASTDNSFAPKALVENKLETVQKLEAENDKTERAMLSHDCIFHTTKENEFAVEHKMEESRTPSELNLNLDAVEGEETSSKELSEHITPEVAVNVSDGVLPSRDVSEELLYSVSGDRIVKLIEMQTDASEGKVDVEYSHVTDSAQVVDSVNGNIEETNSKVNSNGDVCVVSVPDSVPMQEITVEILDATLAFERMITCTDLALEEGCYDTSELANTGKSGGVSSQCGILKLDNVRSTEDMLKQNVGQNQRVVTQNVLGDTNQLSDPKASDKHIESETLEVSSSCEEQQERSVYGVSLQVDETLVPVKEVINACDSDDIGDDEMVKLEGAALKMTDRIEGEDESKAGITQTETCYDSSLPENISAVSETKATRHDMANNRNEEIIMAKVTNWGSGKQRTPLRLLLGEEDAERSWPESPIHENTVTKIGFSEMEKEKEKEMEWNSPTRYPVNIIKTEKKRTKYWPHLLCCSSLYAAR